MNILVRILWTLAEPVLSAVQLAAGFVLGIAFGLIALVFDAVFGLAYLGLMAVFAVAPIVLFFYVLYLIGKG